MSQIKKYQTGSGAGGIKPSKTKFKINGNDYELDDVQVQNHFDPIFKDLVARGEAKERDREEWANTFQEYTAQAKAGTYGITSSGDTAMSAQHTGEEGANLGTNEDGSTARKTKAGNLLSKSKKTDEQRMSMLNYMVDNRLVGDYNTLQAKNKIDADAKTAKDKATGEKSILDKMGMFGRGFGSNRFGADYETEAGQKLVLGNWWDPKGTEANRMSQFGDYMTKDMASIFDVSLDAHKDYLKTQGKDLDAMRTRVSQYYDQTTGKLKTQPKTLKEYLNLANGLDTMVKDNPFLDIQAWKTMNGDAPSVAATPKIATPIVPGKIHFDPKSNTLLDEDGKAYDGHYVHNSNYYDYGEKTGAYVAGKKVDQNAYNTFVKGVFDDPNQVEKYSRLQQRQGQFLDAYKVYNNPGADGTMRGIDYNSTVAGQGDFVWRGFEESPDQGSNITSGFSNAAKAKGHVFSYTNGTSKDMYGQPLVKTMLMTKSGKRFAGYLNKNPVTGKWDLNGMDKGTGKINRTRKVDNPEVRELLESLGDFDPKRVNGDAAAQFQVARENANQDSGLFDAAGNWLDKWIGDDYFLGKAYNGVKNSLKDGSDKQAVAKKQLGGYITSQKDVPFKGATVGQMRDSTYNLSDQDKRELAALGLDLGGVVASLTGVGSVAAAGMGVAGTSLQLYNDVKRDGLDLGDAGMAALGYGLDAASIIPGLGLVGKGAKTAKTLARTSKVLIPALTAFGAYQAAGVVKDLVTGKKNLSDLSVDDLRSLTNGIHGAIGGKRMIDEHVATTRSKGTTSNEIKLANGDTKILDAEEVARINASPNKIKTAKELLIAREPTLKLEDVELDKSHMNLKFWKGQEKLNIKTSSKSGDLILKDINEYQGSGFTNWYTRRAIKNTAYANPNMDGSDKVFGQTYDQYGNRESNNQMGSPWNLFGVGVRGTSTVGTKFAENAKTTTPKGPTGPLPTPDNLQGKAILDKLSDDDKMKLIRRIISQKESDVEVKFRGHEFNNSKVGEQQDFDVIDYVVNTKHSDGSQMKKIQDQIAEIFTKASKSGLAGVQFKEGGILKAANGVKIKPKVKPKYIGAPAPIWGDPNEIMPEVEALKPKDWKPSTNEFVLPNKLNAFNTFHTADNPYNLEAYKNKDTDSSGYTAPGGYKTDNIPTFDKHKVAELGRAALISFLNKQRDTKVERKTIDAPLEVPISVHGNLYAKNAADQKANQLIQSIPQGSDQQVNGAMLLQANAQGNQIRTQGDMMNIDAINQSRAQSAQVAAQHSAMRTEVANQNRGSLALATQAERDAKAVKQASITKPFIDYMANENYNNLRKQSVTDNNLMKLGAIGEQEKYNKVVMDVTNKMNQLDALQTNGTPLSKEQLAQYTQLQLIGQQYQTKLNLANTKLSMDPKYRTDINYYKYDKDWAPEKYEKGGEMKRLAEESKLKIAEAKVSNESSKQASKNNHDRIKTKMLDDSKKELAALKEIHDLIKMALK